MSDAMRNSCPRLSSLLSLKGSDGIPPTDTTTWVKSWISSSHSAGFPWLPFQSHGSVCVSPSEGSGGAPPEPPEAEQIWTVLSRGKSWEQNCVFSHWLLLDEANQQSGNYNLSVLKTIALKHSASTGFWYVYWQYTSQALPFLLEY